MKTHTFTDEDEDKLWLTNHGTHIGLEVSDCGFLITPEISEKLHEKVLELAKGRNFQVRIPT